MAGSARAHTPWAGPATAAPANAGGGKEGPMMITPQSPHALRTMRLLCSAAAAGTFALACASAAQAADAPVSSPTSPPKVTTTAQKPAAPSRANRLQAICSSADLNHDGKVSLEEFHRDIVQGWHNLSPDATGHVQHLFHVPGFPQYPAFSARSDRVGRSSRVSGGGTAGPGVLVAQPQPTQNRNAGPRPVAKRLRGVWQALPEGVGGGRHRSPVAAQRWLFAQPAAVA